MQGFKANDGMKESHTLEAGDTGLDLEKRKRMKHYTKEERQQILGYAKEFSVAQAAKKFGCSDVTIYKWRGKSQATKPTGSKATTVIGAQKNPHFTVEVPIPDHVLQNAVKTFLSEKLGLKLVQF